MKRNVGIFSLGLFLILASPGHGLATERLTPLLMHVLEAPVPVKGSDGRYHLVYELQIGNATPLAWRVDQVEVLGDKPRHPLKSLSGESLKGKMGLLGNREGADSLQAAQTAVVWIALAFNSEKKIPKRITHRVRISSGEKKFEQSGASVTVLNQAATAIAPPLRGTHWIAADGCCESIRHVRALLPVDGKLFSAQRFAVDWEQLGPEQKIFAGDPKAVESYYCYGREVYAVADGKVIAAVDGLPNQIPGRLPENISLAEADGNHIIEEIAPGVYALYAHLKPGSVRVKAGETVRAGEMMALVGNSGNTSEPHLHFHLMDGPSALASNGLPYVLNQFDLVGRTPGTAAFDEAALKGIPLTVLPVKDPGAHRRELPLDQTVVNFAPAGP